MFFSLNLVPRSLEKSSPCKSAWKWSLTVQVIQKEPDKRNATQRNEYEYKWYDMKRNEYEYETKVSRKGKEKKAKGCFCHAEILQFLKGNISFNMRPWELKISPITVSTNFHKLFNRLESIPIYCDAFYTQSYNMPMRQKVNNDVGKDHPII